MPQLFAAMVAILLRGKNASPLLGSLVVARVQLGPARYLSACPISERTAHSDCVAAPGVQVSHGASIHGRAVSKTMN